VVGTGDPRPAVSAGRRSAWWERTVHRGLVSGASEGRRPKFRPPGFLGSAAGSSFLSFLGEASAICSRGDILGGHSCGFGWAVAYAGLPCAQAGRGLGAPRGEEQARFFFTCEDRPRLLGLVERGRRNGRRRGGKKGVIWGPGGGELE